MKGIDQIQNQGISILREEIGKNKLNQDKKPCFKKQIPPPDVVIISRVVQSMNNYLKKIGRNDVKIKVYKLNGEIIVRAESKKHGTIIKTIKLEKLLNLNSGISGMVGLLVNAEA